LIEPDAQDCSVAIGTIYKCGMPIDSQTRLTRNQKLMVGVVIGAACLEFFDYFIIALVLAFMSPLLVRHYRGAPDFLNLLDF